MSTTEKISIKGKKTLKLNNALIAQVNDTSPMEIQKRALMMQNYIKANGKKIVGPLINHSYSDLGENNQMQVKIKLIMQLDSPLHSHDKNYEFIKQLKVENCLFARFNEKEENIRFAYFKLNTHAFENDLSTSGESYTVYVKQTNDKLMADIFMPLQD
ncbi:hypothetical protein [Bacillus wiedmannii]|uniref:hypothetical protein n=1 Tax=Bacillus wiedmannii TaxID=1890302 RepID=UPI003F8FE83F